MPFNRSILLWMQTYNSSSISSLLKPYILQLFLRSYTFATVARLQHRHCLDWHIRLQHQDSICALSSGVIDAKLLSISAVLENESGCIEEEGRGFCLVDNWGGPQARSNRKWSDVLPVLSHWLIGVNMALVYVFWQELYDRANRVIVAHYFNEVLR